MTRAPRKRGRKPGICLTSRDLLILKEVEPGRVMGLSEVHQNHFAGQPRRSAWHRMGRLTRAGLLRECRGDGGGLLGWFLPRSGVRAPVYRTALDHDVMVRDVMEIFRRSPIYRSARMSQSLGSEMMRDAWRADPDRKDQMRLGIPDALIEVEVEGKRAVIALEVELTRKTRARLEKKFEALSINPRWDWVFFVARGEVLLELTKRMEAWTAKRNFLVRMARERNGIFFCELGTLLREGAEATWEGRSSSFKLCNLKP